MFVTDHHHSTSSTAMSVALHAAAVALCLFVGAPPVHAQTEPAGDQIAVEELEPLIIGRGGTTLIGIAGYVDRFLSSEEIHSTLYTAHFEVLHFLGNRLAVRGGLAGSGRIGDQDDESAAGHGVPALHGTAGGLFYFSPGGIVSLYTGADYWIQLTQRAASDAGALVGTLGVQGALSSRASLYLEGGYGIGLRKGEDDDTLTRYVGRIGVRLKF